MRAGFAAHRPYPPREELDPTRAGTEEGACIFRGDHRQAVQRVFLPKAA